MDRKKAWVWFKGGLTGGVWVSGFIASTNEKEGILIEKVGFVSCRVPEWRISFEEPKNEKEGPQIPKDPIWKYI